MSGAGPRGTERVDIVDHVDRWTRALDNRVLGPPKPVIPLPPAVVRRERIFMGILVVAYVAAEVVEHLARSDAAIAMWTFLPFASGIMWVNYRRRTAAREQSQVNELDPEHPNHADR